MPLSSIKPRFDIMLNGRPYVASSVVSPVGQNAYAYILAQYNNYQFPVGVSFHRGVPIEDERQAAEARLRSFERNNGQYAYCYHPYFSIWDQRRLNEIPPKEHFYQAEPELDLTKISTGEWTIDASYALKVPQLVISDKQGVAIFCVMAPDLISDIISRYNAVQPDDKQINHDTPGFDIFKLLDYSA